MSDLGEDIPYSVRVLIAVHWLGNDLTLDLGWVSTQTFDDFTTGKKNLESGEKKVTLQL